MCDTLVALGNSTKDGSVIFGKNSDRLGNEPQLITYSPRSKHSKGDELKCTHISIPQENETAAILMSQPYWMWGAEMAANEYGVVIGNEAVPTREPLKEKGLLGMDLLRLGVERGKTAKEALYVIIDLLDKYGQGGIHNLKGLNYHNSMIIADYQEAYVLEMAGEWWIVEYIKEFRSISNNISIRGKGDLRKKGIIQYAIEKGYCKDDNDFDFKMVFSASPLPEKFPKDSRDGCTLNQLAENKGNITFELMIDFLREHNVGICMHGRNDQSVGSQVSILRKQNHKSFHLFTGSTVPCLSIYKPYTFPFEDQNLLEAGPYNEMNENWYWIRHKEYIKNIIKKPNKEIIERNNFYNKIGDIEKKLNSCLNNLNNNFESISDQDFLKRIKEINKYAWNKAEELIK